MAGREEYSMDFMLNAALNGNFKGTFSSAQAEFAKLEQRIRELKVLRRDTQEIALVLERYYDRRYHKNDRYTF